MRLQRMSFIDRRETDQGAPAGLSFQPYSCAPVRMKKKISRKAAKPQKNRAKRKKAPEQELYIIKCYLIYLRDLFAALRLCVRSN